MIRDSGESGGRIQTGNAFCSVSKKSLALAVCAVESLKSDYEISVCFGESYVRAVVIDVGRPNQ
jgi:hypothetical protein